MSRLVDADTVATIRDTVSSAASYTVDTVSSTSHAVVNYGRDAKNAITPYLQYIAAKCVSLWNASKPYFKEIVEFIKSPTGVCLILLSCTFALMKISQSTEDRILSTVLMITGIATAIMLGAYLLHTGIIPLHVFKIA